MEDHIPDLAERLHRPDSIMSIVMMCLFIAGYVGVLSLCLYFRWVTRRHLAVFPRRDLMLEKGEDEIEIDRPRPR